MSFAFYVQVSALSRKNFLIICIGCANYSYRYPIQPIVLIIGTDYAYGRCIGTSLPPTIRNIGLGLFKRNHHTGK